MHYNNNSATFNRVHNLVITKTNQQTLTGTFIDIFWTEIFKEVTGHTTGKSLRWN